jgi:acyl-CoA thioesterase
MGAKKAQALAEAVGKAMYAVDRCDHANGIVLEDIGPGRARMSMVVREDQTNGHGSCHGGVIFILADSCFAYACNSYNQNAVAANCDIVFPAPARIGDKLTAVGEEKHKRGRSGIYDITVSNQHGEVVALFRGHSRRIEGTIVAEEEIEK